jgi:tetratricopeptide (TPR) repeat protein
MGIWLSTVTSIAQESPSVTEDELIIKGILYTEFKAYDKSWEVFERLYDLTGEKTYLFREVAAALLGRTHISQSIARLKGYDRAHPDMLEVKRLLIPLYLTNQQLPEAKKEAKILLKYSQSAVDLDLAANPYLYSGDFKKALELLQRAYEKSSNETILLRMAAIMDEYTGERQKAIQLLETHRRMNLVTSNDVYFKLLTLYVKENDVDGVLSIYQALYENDKNDEYLQKIIKAYAFKGDVEGAIHFLEKNQAGLKTLFQLYKSKKYFQKALKLAQKFYEEEKDPKWLAEMAILYYEEAKDKNDKAMIEKVVKTFDKALSLGVDDSIYLNYYGYTLIDKNIDVKKGMKILKNALLQQPDNTYYLDSLAWGYYKERSCKKAYELMKRVVDQEGLKEPEIADHWSLIKKCKEGSASNSLR